MSSPEHNPLCTTETGRIYQIAMESFRASPDDYYVLASNVYYRAGRDEDLCSSDHATIEEHVADLIVDEFETGEFSDYSPALPHDIAFSMIQISPNQFKKAQRPINGNVMHRLLGRMSGDDSRHTNSHLVLLGTKSKKL